MARAKKPDSGTKRSTKKPIEQYEHTREDQKRLNNPPVGLVKPENDPDTRPKTYAYDPHLDPQLVWAGRAEHTSFEVPTVSLHVHERIDPKTILAAVRKQNGENGKAGAARAPTQIGDGAAAAYPVRIWFTSSTTTRATAALWKFASWTTPS